MADDVVLAVDLDRTLIKSDILYESFWALAAASIWRVSIALLALLRGKAAFKASLSRHAVVDPVTLKYNQAVIDYVRHWRDAGGRTVLVTATDQRVASAIAEHLGLFDEVHGSDGTRNLKGSAKAAFLTDRFGAGNFDYVGDSSADLPVWQAARRALSVAVPSSLARRIASRSGDVEALVLPTFEPRAYLRALRPHQWLKNLLVFLPLVAAHAHSVSAWLAAGLAFVSFSLVASGVYLLNDLLDLAADRAHPRKRNRPLASGAVPLEHGTLLAPLLFLGGIAVGALTGRIEFLGVLFLYMVVTMAYSLHLKRRPVIDICVLAGLYTVRVLAGAAAADIPLSVWLLAFSIFLFLSLAAVKRQAELVDVMKSGRLSASGRGYHAEDLPIVTMMAIAAGYVSVLVMALYLDSMAVGELYAHPLLLWGVCPVLLYWISRMALIAHRGGMHDDPIVFAVRDQTSRFCGVAVLLVVLAATVKIA